MLRSNPCLSYPTRPLSTPKSAVPTPESELRIAREINQSADRLLAGLNQKTIDTMCILPRKYMKGQVLLPV